MALTLAPAEVNVLQGIVYNAALKTWNQVGAAVPPGVTVTTINGCGSDAKSISDAVKSTPYVISFDQKAAQLFAQNLAGDLKDNAPQLQQLLAQRLSPAEIETLISNIPIALRDKQLLTTPTLNTLLAQSQVVQATPVSTAPAIVVAPIQSTPDECKYIQTGLQPWLFSKAFTNNVLAALGMNPAVRSLLVKQRVVVVTSSKPGVAWWVWLIVAIIIVLIILIIIYFVYQAKNKKAAMALPAAAAPYTGGVVPIANL